MIIHLKDRGEVVLFAEDPTKPREHVFIYRLKNLDLEFSDQDASAYYVAVPNGGNITLNHVPKGKYNVIKLNKD